jgi:hypothetical protein
VLPDSVKRGRSLLGQLRHLAGIPVVSWRYLWQTTPLHRGDEAGDDSDLPPELPEELLDDAVQRVSDGTGPLLHRTFRVRIEDAACAPQDLMASITEDMNRAMPKEVVFVRKTRGELRGLRPGDELSVHMPGPWGAPVRVVSCTPVSFRLATLNGHLEAGVIEFRTSCLDDFLWFEIEAWARASTRTVHLLYNTTRLAKEMQLNMWVRFCLAAVELSGGRAPDGVQISTRRVEYSGAG